MERATHKEAKKGGPSGGLIRRAEPDGAGTLRDLRTVVHEMAGLVDGSMRLLELARRELAASSSSGGNTGAQDGAMRHLEGARAALAHIAGLMRRAGGTPTRRPGPASSADIGAALRSAVDVLRPIARERGIAVGLSIEEPIGAGDAGAVYTIVTNGIRNAVESIGPAGGTVTVRAAAERGPGGTALVVEVIDDGPGPAPGAEGRFFDPGFTTKAGSSGIGLALAREMAEEMGGTIALTQREGGRGAVLRLVVPAPEAGEPGRAARPEREGEGC